MELIENERDRQRVLLAQRDAMIRKCYKQLRRKYVNASFHRICLTIAKEMNISRERVRQILSNKYNINSKQHSL